MLSCTCVAQTQIPLNGRAPPACPLTLHPPRSTKAAINPLLTADTSSRLPFWVVGNDDGFWPILSSPMISLQMGPAERYDVVVDFSGKHRRPLLWQSSTGMDLVQHQSAA